MYMFILGACKDISLKYLFYINNPTQITKKMT